MRYLVGFVLALALSFIGGCGDDEVEVCFSQTNTWKKDNPPFLPSPPVPLDPDDLLGTYTLTHFWVHVYVGDEGIGEFGEDEFADFSGRLEVGESTVISTVTIEGETETLGGPYTTVVEDDHGGFFIIPSQSYDLRYVRFGLSDEFGDYQALSVSSTERTCEMTTL